MKTRGVKVKTRGVKVKSQGTGTKIVKSLIQKVLQAIALILKHQASLR